jgi:hypothetical protein
MPKKMNAVEMTTHVATVSAIMAVGSNKAEALKVGKQIADALSALFADVSGDDTAFVAEFGNGENPKSKTFKAGALAEDVRAKVKHMKDAEKVKSILTTLKSRLSEARALRKAGGMPQPGENLQAALKRYKTPKVEADKKAAAPDAKGMTLAEFAKGASIDEMADLVSIWVAHHGKAAVGLAKALTDSLPVSVRRTKAA